MSRGDFDDRDRDDDDARDRGRRDDFDDRPRVDPYQKVKVPAIGLIVTAVLWLLLVLIGLGWELSGMGEKLRQDQIKQIEDNPNMPAQQKKDMLEFQQMIQRATSPPWSYVTSGISLLFSVITLIGALKMKNLSGRGWAYTSAIVAMIPCLSSVCCLLGLPFGIWALVALSDPDVKRAFAKGSPDRRRTDDFDDDRR